MRDPNSINDPVLRAMRRRTNLTAAKFGEVHSRLQNLQARIDRQQRQQRQRERFLNQGADQLGVDPWLGGSEDGPIFYGDGVELDRESGLYLDPVTLQYRRAPSLAQPGIRPMIQDAPGYAPETRRLISEKFRGMGPLGRRIANAISPLQQPRMHMGTNLSRSGQLTDVQPRAYGENELPSDVTAFRGMGAGPGMRTPVARTTYNPAISMFRRGGIAAPEYGQRPAPGVGGLASFVWGDTRSLRGSIWSTTKAAAASPFKGLQASYNFFKGTVPQGVSDTFFAPGRFLMTDEPRLRGLAVEKSLEFWRRATGYLKSFAGSMVPDPIDVFSAASADSIRFTQSGQVTGRGLLTSYLRLSAELPFLSSVGNVFEPITRAGATTAGWAAGAGKYFEPGATSTVLRFNIAQENRVQSAKMGVERVANQARAAVVEKMADEGMSDSRIRAYSAAKAAEPFLKPIVNFIGREDPNNYAKLPWDQVFAHDTGRAEAQAPAAATSAIKAMFTGIPTAYYSVKDGISNRIWLAGVGIRTIAEELVKLSGAKESPSLTATEEGERF